MITKTVKSDNENQNTMQSRKESYQWTRVGIVWPVPRILILCRLLSWIVRARTDFVKVQTFLFTSVEMTAKRNFQDTLNYKGYSYFVWKSLTWHMGFLFCRNGQTVSSGLGANHWGKISNASCEEKWNTPPCPQW